MKILNRLIFPTKSSYLNVIFGVVKMSTIECKAAASGERKFTFLSLPAEEPVPRQANLLAQDFRQSLASALFANDCPKRIVGDISQLPGGQ